MPESLVVGIDHGRTMMPHGSYHTGDGDSFRTVPRQYKLDPSRVSRLPVLLPLARLDTPNRHTGRFTQT